MIASVPKTGIRVSKVAWHEVSDKVETWSIQKALEGLEPSVYGKAVKKVHFIYVAVPPENTLHPDEILYDPEKKMVTLELNLRYDLVENSDAASLLDSMARLFIGSIERYPETGVKGFDCPSFKEEVERRFKANGLLLSK